MSHGLPSVAKQTMYTQFRQKWSNLHHGPLWTVVANPQAPAENAAPHSPKLCMHLYGFIYTLVGEFNILCYAITC